MYKELKGANVKSLKILVFLTHPTLKGKEKRQKKCLNKIMAVGFLYLFVFCCIFRFTL